jgi:hypothetical protein
VEPPRERLCGQDLDSHALELAQHFFALNAWPLNAPRQRILCYFSLFPDKRDLCFRLPAADSV